MTEVKCLRCGVVNLVTDEVCKTCGAELQPVVQNPESTPPPDSEFRMPPPPNTGYQLPPPPANAPFIGPFLSAGDVIGPTVKLFTQNFWLITKIVFVIVAPFELFKSLSFGNMQLDWQLTLGIVALQVLSTVIVIPALFYSLMRVVETGSSPSINEAFRWGWDKLPKLAVAALLSWLITAALTLLCIIPGIIAGLALQLVYPIAVFEKCSAVDALKRSRSLTTGHLWNIFAANFVIGLLGFLVTIPFSGALAALAFNGVRFWPLDTAVSIFGDIVAEISTVLSLVLYISILRTSDARQPVIE